MEFDEHEHEQDHDQEPDNPNYEAVAAAAAEVGVEGGTASRKSGISYRYRECLKNHAVGIGGHAVDGCGEFIAAGGEGTLDALSCAACNCHRNFHRKESDGGGGVQAFQYHHHRPPHPHPHPPQPHHHHHHNILPYYRTGTALQVTPQQSRPPLALPPSSTSREDEDMSNPSSSGGGGGGGSGGSKKRFRTKFSQEQKDRMLGFAERIGWRIQKQDEPAVEQFCQEMGVKRQVLKVWMHNNKHTLGKKP